jgi:cell wall-associated NlpC family hydrolase
VDIITLGGYIMYKPSKKVLVVGLSAGLLVAMSGVNIETQAGQKYDSTNVGITGKVGDYIKNGNSSDPVADLTAGAVTKADAVTTTKKEEKKPAEEASSNDAKASEKKSSVEAKNYPQFQDRAVVVCDGQVNIREKDSTDSEVVGYLENGGICLVDEIGKEWTKIESGCCVGYIANEFLLYGDDAGEWSDNNGIERFATINTATLKVRESKDEASDCVTLVPEGEEFYVYSNSPDWVELKIDDDIQGFVRKEFVTIQYNNPRAVTVEEQEEADRIAQEEADRAWIAYLDEQKALNESQGAADSSNGAGDVKVADNSDDTNDDGIGSAAVAAPADENADGAATENTDDTATDENTGNENTDDTNTDDSSANDVADDSSTDDSTTDDSTTDDTSTDEATDDSSTDDSTTDDSSTDDSTDDSSSDDSSADEGESGDSSSDGGDSSDSSDSSSDEDVSLGQQVANYALQFVGNPYVWGGTSLTDGADCSGFVLSVYAHFGYSLPHDAELQANYGREVSLSDLQPGDLLFYWNGYEIGHVTMYIGNGQVVHASSPETGIKISSFNYRTPIKAVRLIGS